MKTGWQIKKLGDIAEVQSGGTPLVSNKTFWNGDIPWYSSGELNHLHTSTPERYITAAGLQESNAKVFPAGSLLIGMYDTAALKMSILDRAGTFNQAIAGVKPNSEIDLVFILYAISSVKERVLGQRRGVRQKNLSLGKIRDIELSIPPLSEQRRIVSILSGAFDRIASAKANAEKNLQNARALFESHLQAVFTRRGKGWIEKPLVEVCTLINGRAYNKDELLNVGKYPVLRVGNFFTNNHWYYSDLELDKEKYCDKGDLLYAWSASFGPRIWDGGKVIYHYHIWKVIPNASIVEKRFLLHLLEWDVDQIKQAHGTGTTMMHVSKGSMESRVVQIAPLQVQGQIVSQLDDLDVETRRLESVYRRKLAALDELKKSLLHKAFSGEL
jgi:type I restriction enzyme, S subunit